jgi:hypothetical protein
MISHIRWLVRGGEAWMAGPIVAVSALSPRTRDHQRQATGDGEQSDGDLRIQAAFLGEP